MIPKIADFYSTIDAVQVKYLLSFPDTHVDFAESASTNERLLREFVEVDFERQKQIRFFDDVRAREYADLAAGSAHPPVLIAAVPFVLRQDLDVAATYQPQLIVLLRKVVVQREVAAVGRAAGGGALGGGVVVARQTLQSRQTADLAPTLHDRR